MCFSASVVLNITNQSRHHFSMIFLMVCTFSYGHLFLVSIFYQLTSEKNQVYTGNLIHCRQTLQLIKFSLIKKHEGMQQRKLLGTIQISLPKYSKMFLLSYGKLSLQFTSFYCLLTYTLHVYASENSFNWYFKALIYICKPAAICGRKSNIILTFLL